MKSGLMKILFGYLLFGLPISLCHAIAAGPKSVGADEIPAGSVTFAQPENIRFKSGEPYTGELLEDALVLPRFGEEEKLKRDLKIVTFFLGRTDARVEVIAGTDDRECGGRACYELASRRALLVYKWLVSEGVPKERMALPVSCGSASPIENNDDEESRSRNRRAEIGFIYKEDQPFFLSNPHCEPAGK